jgi:hypothetical protein
MAVNVLDERRRERRDDFHDQFLETIDRPDPAERMPRSRNRAAMRRRAAYVEVDRIVEAARARLARAEVLAANVGYPAAGAIRRAREALEGAKREPCW